MSKMGAYQPPEKYKNYLLPSSKPLRSHTIYKEKVWTLQERIYNQLKRVSELLESLYPKLTDDFSKNVTVVIEKNLGTLIEDLDHMQGVLKKKQNSFNTQALKTNQARITEMKEACDTLQTVRSYEFEYKKLNKIKHALKELEHLIQPTRFEKSLEKLRAKNKPKAPPKKQKAVSKKAKPTKKLLKPKKTASKNH